MCEHGNRIVARTEKNGTKTVLAAHFNVRKSRCLRDNASVVRLQQLGVRDLGVSGVCLLYTSPSPRDRQKSRMPSSA